MLRLGQYKLILKSFGNARSNSGCVDESFLPGLVSFDAGLNSYIPALTSVEISSNDFNVDTCPVQGPKFRNFLLKNG
jgi:hypothetical protein